MGALGSAGERSSRIVEAVGLFSVLALLGHFLTTSYVLHPDSDPMRWFTYARDFLGGFGEVKLAYGFPLVAALAIRVVGPFFGFLVNLPVVLLLAVLVFAFARANVRGGPAPGHRVGGSEGPAAFGSFAALLCFIAWNSGESSMLLRLANPYRDALSYVFLTSACLCAIRQAHAGRGAASALGAGACLALACSTRETSLLMVAPFAIFALVSRLGDPSVRLSRGMLAFGVAFSLGMAPLLLQNWLLSGSAIVPGQAAGSLGATQTFFPGLGPLYFAETFPKLLYTTAEHLGPVGLVLVGLGLVAGWVERNSVVLGLSVPAVLIYAVFYGGYYTIVPRYLFVLDLFLAPLAGVGAAALFSLALRRFESPALRRGMAQGSLVLAVVGALAVTLSAGRTQWVRVDALGVKAERFTLGDARRLRDGLAGLVPASATFAAERPVSSLLRCFTEFDVISLMFDTGNRNLKRPTATKRIAAELTARVGDTFFLGAREGGPGAAERFLNTQFDLTPLTTIASADYHISSLYPGAETLTLMKVEPWSRYETQVLLTAADAGLQILSLDVGRLSRYARSHARVYWNDELLDEHAADQTNHYLVSSAADAAEALVRLESDGPVPAVLRAELQPARAPIVLDLRDQAMLGHASRLSASFFEDLIPKAPVIDGRGSLMIPTPGPSAAAFLVLAIFSLMGEADVTQDHRLTLQVEGVARRSERVGIPEDETEGWSWYEKSLILDGAVLEGPRARLDLEIEASPGLPRPPRLILVALEIYRFPLTGRFEIEFGVEGDDPFVLEGFAPQTDDAWERPLPVRWTGKHASFPLFGPPQPRAMQLRVAYLTGVRPGNVPPASPRFSLNGARLEGRKTEEPVVFGRPAEDDPSRMEAVGTLTEVTETFEIPEGMLRGPVNSLEVEAETWVPARLRGLADERELGVMLHRVILEEQ